MTYSIQLANLSSTQVDSTLELGALSPATQSYITQFDSALSPDDFNSDLYSYRLLFTKKLTGKVGQADMVVEFVDPSSELAEQIDKQYWVQKEVEKPKFTRREVLQFLKKEGFPLFGSHDHTQLWRMPDAKNPAKGYGVQIGSQWLWYERWKDEVLRHCTENADRYVQT